MTYQTRQIELICRIAQLAEEQPILSSGLWFHNDIRNNFYYASYLFAAANDYPEKMNFDVEAAKAKASAVLGEVLQLQDRNAGSDTYGHWPLNLGADPQQAKPHTLPVELMGSLMAFFASKYRDELSEQLGQAFDEALNHIYQCGFYRKPMSHYGHHEAKYTAAKLIFGQLFEDTALLDDGKHSLSLTLSQVKTHGMCEYGSLPWFWHWVQAFTCAWQMTEDASLQQQLSDMLDYLWNERSVFYLRGAWIGPHSRGLAHDIPGDANVLFDYVQFGDFELPAQMPRTEYAGFLFYEAPKTARASALDRSKATEIKRLVPRRMENPGEPLHSYVYRTAHYAVGGMWERIAEFDNEQHRWDVTLPVQAGRIANKAYFFLPAQGSKAEDLRHQSGNTEVLLHKNVAVALYPIDEACSESIRGCLPAGAWLEEERALFGRCGDVFIAFYLMKPYTVEKQGDYSLVRGESGTNGVVMECLSAEEAMQMGIADLHSFAKTMREKQPVFTNDVQLSAQYTSLCNDTVKLTTDGRQEVGQYVNGRKVDFAGYSVS